MEVKQEDFRAKKEELLGLLRREGLTPEVERKIIEVYGGRGRKALSAIRQGRVRRKGKIWVVRGRTEEYEIVKDLCYCMDYVLNVVTGKAGVDLCYHALAKKILEILDERGG